MKHQDRYAGRLKIIHNPNSLGMEAASNIGIASCDSTYIVVLDDDDTWHNDMLQNVSDHFLKLSHIDSLAGVMTQVTYIHEKVVNDKIIETGRGYPHRGRTGISIKEICYFTATHSFFFKRSAYDAIGKFREDLEVLGDFEFNLRFIRKFDIVLLPKALAFYHIRPKVGPVLDAHRNSVNGDRYLWALNQNRIIHNMVREDLDNGRFGMGCLVSLTMQLEHLNTNTTLLGKIYNVINRSRILTFFLGKLGIISNTD